MIKDHFVTAAEETAAEEYPPTSFGVKIEKLQAHNKIFFAGGTLNIPGLFDQINLRINKWFVEDSNLKKKPVESIEVARKPEEAVFRGLSLLVAEMKAG
jgi:hypothetical protein